jgi:hypothetical protein
VGSRHIGAALTLLSFAIAFLQRPGEVTADTKIDLHVEPARFLGEVASVWSSSGGLGQVQAGQYSGYLWPMGPFFALGDLAGVSEWVVQRLWLGVLLAVAAWGVVKLVEALADARSGDVALSCTVAGALYVVNPYVTTFTQATTVTLLGYAALPWLLLAVHRGLRTPGRWWWPALFALVLTSTGGGVNAAVTGWVLLGPLLLLLYEWLTGPVGGRAVWSLAWRTALLSIAASLWWLVPVAVHAAFGINFLPYTESAGAIWATTSIPESVRLMGYWLSYLGGGYGDVPLPYFDASAELLFSRPVVVASLLVPGLAIAGLVWTRRWRYAPFFLLLLLAGLLVMTAGFPDGTPLRRAVTGVYNHIEPVQFLRTTYKAGPLVALALACLGGAAAAELWRRLPARAPRIAAGVAGVALVCVGSWPLVTGRAVDPKFAFEEVPDAWQQAADRVDAQVGANARALILPGQLYAFYDWGATVDPILPALAERPVASKTAVPYSDLRAVDALWTVDAGIHQERFVPGQLEPLLAWLGVGTVVAGADDDFERSGAPPPAEAARALSLAGAGDPAASYGPGRVHQPAAGSLTAPVRLPQVRLYESLGAGLVRVEPVEGGMVLDGSAEGIASLAAFEGLVPGEPLAYAGDFDDAALAGAASRADEVVITDTNRRRIVSPARPRQTWGRTLEADEPVPVDAPQLEPFGEQREDEQTVAVLRGVEALRSPFAPGFPQFPEHGPFAAFDGERTTWWEADRELRGDNRWVEVRFDSARDVPFIEVVPRRQDATSVTEVEVAGRRFALAPGSNRLELGLRGVDRLRVRITARDLPDGRRGGPGALAEVRVPGLRVRELLRPPRRLERALDDLDLSDTAVTYLFTRATGDLPFRRQPVSDPDAAAVPDEHSVEPALIREAGDAERDIEREIEPPVERAYDVEAWVSAAAGAPDPELDRLAGFNGPERFTSSSRYEGRPGARASKAFDGDPATAWVGRAVPGADAWLEWRSARPARIRSLRLLEPPAPARLPSRVRVGGRGPVFPVGADGVVRLPRPLTGRVFRLEVADAPGEAVGIGEVEGRGVPRVAIPRRGALRGRCGDVTVRGGGGAVALRATGRIEDLDAAYPVRARRCGRPLRLPARRQTLAARGGTLLPYMVRLRSPARGAEVSRPIGTVVDPGEGDGSSRNGVRLDLTGAARLVLAESFNEGWRASCDGRDLGEPEPAGGFANGWEVPAECDAVEFSFAPQRTVEAGYLLSGGACVVLLLFLVLRRANRRPFAHALPRAPGRAGLRSRPLPAAAAVALPLAAIVALVFALRAGAVAFPLLTLLFWRGASVTRLLGVAGALMALAVPAAYALFPPDDLGGHNSSYATELLGAHWIGVAAVVLLALALWRMMAPRPRAGIDYGRRSE